MTGLGRTAFYKTRVKGFAKIHHCIYDVQFQKKLFAIAVYAFLCRRLNNATKQCNPGLDDIAKHIDISTRQVSRALVQLERKDVIKVIRKRGSVNHYVINPPSEWDFLHVKQNKKAKVPTIGLASGDPRSPPTD
jgi:hypothetical protein